MADVLRSAARAGLALLIALLGGCGAPISNQVFLEEALFLGVLPSEARLAPPREVELAPNGDAAVLRAAKQAAADWRGLVQLAIASGEQLRRTEPDERTDVLRRWDAVNAASQVSGGPLAIPEGTNDWWVQAEIVQPDGGAFAWTIAVGPAADGPYTEVAWGEDDGAGTGTLTLDLDAVVEAFGLAPEVAPGQLDADYAPEDLSTDPVTPRTVEATWTPVGLPRAFTVIGASTLGFTGALAVTADGEAWPGGAAVFHGPDGGRAEGAVVDGGGAELAFAACWDGNGHLLWQAGDEGVQALGDPTLCTVGDVF